MKPTKDIICEWRLIVQDSVIHRMKDEDDEADRAIIAIDEYIAWLESELEKKA